MTDKEFMTDKEKIKFLVNKCKKSLPEIGQMIGVSFYTLKNWVYLDTPPQKPAIMLLEKILEEDRELIKPFILEKNGKNIGYFNTIKSALSKIETNIKGKPEKIEEYAVRCLDTNKIEDLSEELALIKKRCFKKKKPSLKPKPNKEYK